MSEHKLRESTDHDTSCTAQSATSMGRTDSTLGCSLSQPSQKKQETISTWPWIIKTNPDGRCFFRSLVIGMDLTLQSAERDENNKPISPLICIKEQCQSDSLRNQVIQYMCDNFSKFSEIDGDMLNADMPRHLQYCSLEERMATMANPIAMAGELEIATTCHVIKRPIVVRNQNDDEISRYGEQDFGQAPPLYVRFLKLQDDIGHFDCYLVENDSEMNNGHVSTLECV